MELEINMSPSYQNAMDEFAILLKSHKNNYKEIWNILKRTNFDILKTVYAFEIVYEEFKITPYYILFTNTSGDVIDDICYDVNYENDENTNDTNDTNDANTNDANDKNTNTANIIKNYSTVYWLISRYMRLYKLPDKVNTELEYISFMDLLKLSSDMGCPSATKNLYVITGKWEYLIKMYNQGYDKDEYFIYIKKTFTFEQLFNICVLIAEDNEKIKSELKKIRFVVR